MPTLPEAVGDVRWRPLRPDDASALHRLVRASEQFDGAPFVTSPQEIARQLAHPESDLATDTIAAGLPDGRLVAFGATRMREAAAGRRSVGQEGTVDPEHRRRGLGTAVLEWTEARGRERAARVGDDVPTYLEVWSNEQWQDRQRFFEGRGYEAIRYYDDMIRPLSEPVPEPTLPEPLRFGRWSPELDEAFRQAHNEAFRDHWGTQPLSEEAWQHSVSGAQHFVPRLSVGAFDGDRLIGYCTAYHAPEDAEATGRVEGWLGRIGVVREWRGKGVASAVMAHVMREMADEGFGYACLGVDSENPTGAVGLYTRLGFTRFERWIRWAKPV